MTALPDAPRLTYHGLQQVRSVGTGAWPAGGCTAYEWYRPRTLRAADVGAIVIRAQHADWSVRLEPPWGYPLPAAHRDAMRAAGQMPVTDEIGDIIPRAAVGVDSLELTDTPEAWRSAILEICIQRPAIRGAAHLPVTIGLVRADAAGDASPLREDALVGWWQGVLAMQGRA